MDRFPDLRKKTNIGMKCIKIVLILINVLYLVISFLMISGATALKAKFSEYYFVYWFNTTIESLSSLWIATGCFLLALSIFGIVAAVKESTLMTNVYGLILALIFILQMASAITAFTLITKTNKIVNNSLDEMMERFSWNTNYRYTMNWVQRTFECCGNEGPFDWRDYEQFSTPRPTYSTRSYWNDSPKEVSITTTEKPLWIKMPQSCCINEDSYDYNNLICNGHFTKGCHGPLQEILSESVMMIGSSALMIGVVQILGVVCSFIFARTIRRRKTNRDIQKWAIHQSMGFDRPAYVDQVPTQETREDEVKNIWRTCGSRHHKTHITISY